MSGLSDILDFKLFEGKGILKDIAKKPSRLLTGVDPASTGFWNAVKGSHDKPLVDEWGGTTKDRMAEMDRAGINTGPGRSTEGLAHIIAAMFAMNGLGKAAGLGEAASGSNATNPALIESAVGTPGYGASSAGPGGVSAGGAGLSSASKWNMLGQQFGKMGQQQPQQDVTEVDLAALADAEKQRERDQAQIALSTKKAKTMGDGGSEAMRRGLSNADPIDANGVQIAAIQELTKRAAELRKRISAAKAKRASRKES